MVTYDKLISAVNRNHAFQVSYLSQLSLRRDMQFYGEHFGAQLPKRVKSIITVYVILMDSSFNLC